eukprot:CAMPEP_0198289436 /NCGR_PEP_ID=MMETSP1449-20131203/7608_1 /TAXON_ID=420275 /ORGANISM="Attheya septentrionalis, Strain CCMP2084" /LENGTH=342 /DNA_ID=CAMNT_0043987753 /DNA_START=25 /DNA_END=1053 /DNA_ORIENTATION=-
MRRSLTFAAVAAVLSQAEGHDYPFVRSETRVLEDGSSYAYLNDLSSYSTQYSKCVRAKIQDDNDDQQEGNSYFVNGRYHAQYKTFASFVLCEDDGSSCGTCDYNTHYVTDLDTYLDSTITSIQEVCQACANQCGRRNLEDGGNDVVANCNTCVSECSLINYGNGGEDETEYMACQAAYADENSGIQYYSGPTCDSSGGLVIGLFYDEDCTVKTGSELDNGFSYDTFKTVETFCGSCSTGMCDDLYPYALHCFGAYNMNANAAEDGDGVNSKSICKAAAQKTNNYKRTRKQKWHIIPVFLVVFSLFGGLTFGSYTYYIRHRDMDAAPMSSDDHQSPTNDYVLS